MNVYCFKCRTYVTSTKHEYFDKEKRLIRTEEVCDKCHLTLSVQHFTPESPPEHTT